MNPNAQKVFVRAAEDDRSSCSKRRPRFSRDQIFASNEGGGRAGITLLVESVISGECPVGYSSSGGLTSDRQESSIPIAGEAKLPKHQGGDHANWMYPSEEQFYEAMKRKVTSNDLE